jgi:hypothetical protein
MRENLETYIATNPFWEFVSDSSPVAQSTPAATKESDLPVNRIKVRPTNLLPDPRREEASKAAKKRWAIWAFSKAQ